MEIEIGVPISDRLAEIIRERTDIYEQEKVAKSHGRHFNTIRSRIIEFNRDKIRHAIDQNMIMEICGIAFRNNKEIISMCRKEQTILNKIK